MTDPSKSRPANSGQEKLEVLRASVQERAIVANLLELYAHDFSEFHEVKVGEDGRFGYKNLDLFWSDATRHPFLARLDGELAGLVLVRQGSEISGNPDVWDMVEFFVLRGYRRHGIGMRIALEVWRKFPGQWEVRVMQRNDPAGKFWRNAISVFAGDTATCSHFEKNGERWQLFSFMSPDPVASGRSRSA
jgi:predicted acetyltransferase